jgi:hypothetical protein
MIGERVTCRHCGVLIEQCPCVKLFRSVDDECRCCNGSMWVAVVRGRIAKFAEFLADHA